MSPLLIVLIILIVLAFAGGGWGWRGGADPYVGGGLGLVGLLLVILLILILLGVIHVQGYGAVRLTGTELVVLLGVIVGALLLFALLLVSAR